MSLMKLPQLAEIDRSRAGVLKIAAPLIGALLRLPPGYETVEVGTLDDGLTLAVLVEGGSLPCHSGKGAANVQLLLHEERAGDVKRVYASWEHDPSVRWLMREDALERQDAQDEAPEG